MPIASKPRREAFAAAEKAIDAEGRPAQEAARRSSRPPIARRSRRAKHADAQPPRNGPSMSTPAKERTPSQKQLAKGLETSLRVTWEEVAAAVAANPADHAGASGSSGRSTRSSEPCPVRRRTPWRWSIDKSKAPDTFVLRRGDYKNRGPKVAPRPPGVILASQRAGSVSRPSIVAERRQDRPSRGPGATGWPSPTIPLTARVIVNRLWQHHFGRGIVATPSDFGVRGEPPSHPELLDWLASELVAGGWRLKPIHRLMVTSATYRQSSRPDAKLAAEDPENTLLGRMNRRRLDAEGVRDAMLAVSGELNPRMGGPGVLAPLEKEVKDLIFTEAEVVDLWPEDRDPAEHLRRSLYLFRKRNVRYPLFDAFDAPDTQTACPRRETSTHALQALTLLNSDFAAGRARALAERIAARGRRARPTIGSDGPTRSSWPASRSRPRSSEPESFLKTQAERIVSKSAARPVSEPPVRRASVRRSAEAAAWVDLALAMLNCNEFLYVP